MSEPAASEPTAPESVDAVGEASASLAAPPSLLGPRIASVGLVAAGALLLTQTFDIARTAGYSPVGPSFVPVFVSLALMALGAAFLIRTTVRPDADLADRAGKEERATHWPTVGVVGVLLLGYGALLAPLGYILATALFFPLGARVLGSRRALRDVALGLVLAAVIWFGFTQLLGVRLPAGLLDPILPGS